MAPSEIARCDGAKTTAPEARLCRKCARTLATVGGSRMVEPAVHMIAKFGKRVTAEPMCHLYIPCGVDIDAVHGGR